ncbi:MAG: hypothetical protein ACOYN0_13290 [Phycisphaerales bacterium]
MRMPVFKPWRAFEEFDHLSDEECEKHVGDAWANCAPWTAKLPLLVSVVTLVLWPTAWVVAHQFLPLSSYVPIPASVTGKVILLAVTSVAAPLCAGLLTRDLVLYVLLRRELRRADCPACGQSLLGLQVQTVGLDPDPTRNSVRCTECGRVHKLMDLGLSPRDLVPLEQRRVPENFGKVKR